jgi:hypothetical protein
MSFDSRLIPFKYGDATKAHVKVRSGFQASNSSYLTSLQSQVDTLFIWVLLWLI